MDRSGCFTWQEATTVSRCTSRPATRSRIRFTASPPKYGLEAAGEDQAKRMLGFVLVATVLGPPGPSRQTLRRTRGCKPISATTPAATAAFHPSGVAATVMQTLQI